MIAEAANGHHSAADRLARKGVFVIPDFLCNAGGVTVSYFEWVQNVTGYYWDLPTVHERLDNLMTEAFWRVAHVRESRNVHTRLAAYAVAVDRVAQAVHLRGWV